MMINIPVKDLVYVRPKMSTSDINREWAENFFSLKTKHEKNKEQTDFIKEFNAVTGVDPRLKIFK